MRTSRVRQPGRRTPLVLLALVVLLAAGGPAGAQTEAAPTDGLTAAELDGRVLTMAIELGEVEADLERSTARRAELAAAIERGRQDYLTGLDAENATRAALVRYSVAAYMVGSIVPPGLTDALVRSHPGDLDNEGRRVLATTVHRELTGDARDATDALDAVVVALDRDEAEAADLDQRLDDLRARKDRLGADIERTRVEAARVRAAEERAAAERARRQREDELRANTPRPESHRSGVVPAMVVPPIVVSRVGGEISTTALNAYWRAASAANGSRPSCAIDWALVAAIGKVETGHATYRGTVLAPDGSTSPTILGIPLDGSNGTLRIDDTDGGVLDGDPIADRAVGPMQFIPGTWRAYAADGNGDGVADPHNIYDSAVAAATYLCRSAGGPITEPANASRAVYAYNRSSAYNLEVITLADRYRRLADPSLPPSVPVTIAPPPDLPPPASPEQPPHPDPDPTSTTTTTAPDPTSTAPP